MSINSIYNYIKRIENALSAPESPEVQFLNIDLYKSKTFNLKSFSLSIFDKISNTKMLLSELKSTIEKTKNEIVEQINSNFNNYVTLISKLQTIDFLIDNITTSLENIKAKINSELDLVAKYENELTQMIKFIDDNDKEIKNVNESIKKYENKIKCENIIVKVDNFLKDNISGLQEKNYTVIRKYFFLLITFYKIKIKGIDYEQNSIIEQSSDKYMKILNEILDYVLQNYFSNQDNTINMKLNANIISLINKLYAIQKSEDVLYEKIYENYTKNEINKIFENNVPVPKIINEIEKMINSNKYQTLMNEFNKERFIQISFVLPFINKFSNDKFLFNCSDSIQFRDNYTSILNFINKYNIENIITSIQNFLQMFSFFTYFQYVQNDISSRLLSIVELDMKKEKDNFAIISGCISNYLKIIKDYTSGNIFIKNLPNFLNFILQCSIFITQIVHNFEESSELLKIYHNALNDTLNFEIAGKDKEKIDNYYKILNQYNEYFMHGDFKKSIEDIAKREMFICKEEKERSSILNEINNICSSITPITAQK